MAIAPNFQFQQHGRSYHLKIAGAAGLAVGVELDEAHWVALSTPLSAINCDETFLQLINTDRSGRITCRELKKAILWLLSVLQDHAGIDQRRDILRLDTVAQDIPDGQQIREAARKILNRIGQSEVNEISLAQVRRIKAEMESTPISEAGVVLPKATENDSIRQFITDVIDTVGGTTHPNGSQGIAAQQLNQFLKEATAFLEWFEQGQVRPAGKTNIMPLGTDTSQAYALLAALQGKFDQYFAQCKILALDENLSLQIGWTTTKAGAFDFDDPEVIEEILKEAKLAQAQTDGLFRFDSKINPYYADTVVQFYHKVVEPVLGKCGNTLSAEQWEKIKTTFSAHSDWSVAQPESAVAQLGETRLGEYLQDNFAKTVRALIENSFKTAMVLDNIRLVEKLILYQAHMVDFANNFISFPHLYDTISRAMFEVGTLVMDGRYFNLAVKVDERKKHIEVARNSNMYVLYLAIEKPDGETEFEVAVPVTSGDTGNLCVGKRGVFHHINGREYDARVLNIIENPISFREALVAPVFRLGRLLTGKIESLSTQAEKKLDAKASTAFSKVVTTTDAKTSAQKQGPAIPTGGMILGAGVALAALGSAAAYITKTLSSIAPLTIALSILGAVLLAMLPMSVVAFLKLRRRDLSAILEGSGWAINARMRLTRKQGKFFTKRPGYPHGSTGIRSRKWAWYLLILLLLTVIIIGSYLWHNHTNKSQSPPPETPANQAK